ncbi:hypothetical protein Daqu01_03370 [Deinococcus aquaticus]
MRDRGCRVHEPSASDSNRPTCRVPVARSIFRASRRRMASVALVASGMERVGSAGFLRGRPGPRRAVTGVDSALTTSVGSLRGRPGFRLTTVTSPSSLDASVTSLRGRPGPRRTGSPAGALAGAARRVRATLAGVTAAMTDASRCVDLPEVARPLQAVSMHGRDQVSQWGLIGCGLDLLRLASGSEKRRADRDGTPVPRGSQVITRPPGHHAGIPKYRFWVIFRKPFFFSNARRFLKRVLENQVVFGISVFFSICRPHGQPRR